MGEKVDSRVEAETSRGGSAASTNPTSTEEGRRGRGRPPGTTSKPTEKIPRLVNVDVPGEEKKEEEKPKRGRPKGTTQTKKKPAAAKKKMDTGHIKMLLLTVSGIIASRPNMQPFMLTDEEAGQIAEPLAAIMAKSDYVSDVAGEYADHIALVVACATIFIPKYLLYKAANPSPKKEVKSNATANQSRTTPASPGTSPGEARNTDLSQTHAKQFGRELHAILPAVTGF